MTNESGVYKIINITNDKCYIGSAINLYKRFSVHKRMLRRNIHHSILLQRAWNKYGEENFVFETVEKCEKSNLINREQFYSDSLRPAYSIRKEIIDSNKGCRWTKEAKEKLSALRKGRILTEEWKQNIGKSRKGKKQSKETIQKRVLSRKGYRHSEETKQKIGKALKRL